MTSLPVMRWTGGLQPRRAGPADLVQAFLSSRSARTRAAYAEDLASFTAFLRAPDLQGAADELLGAGQGNGNALALAFRDHLVAQGYAPATVNRRLAALRSLVLLARMLGYVRWALDVPSLRGESYRDTRGPGLEGVRAILGVLDQRAGAKAVRDRAIIRLLFDLGLRRAEVCSLDVEHVDLEAGVLWVKGKGKVGRVPLSLPRPTVQALGDWLILRGSVPGPLFTNFDRARKGARLTGQSLYRLVRDLGRAAGLDRPVRPHGLRHAAITAALDATRGDVRAVQRFSRHAKLETVTLYDDNRQDLAGQVARLVAAGLSGSDA